MTIPYISYVLKHTLDDCYLRKSSSSLIDIPSFLEISERDSPESKREDINSFIPSFLPALHPSSLPFCSRLFPYSSNKLIIPPFTEKITEIRKYKIDKKN